jgi:hypothetical protein
MNARIIRLVLRSSVRILAGNLIQMFVVKVLIVKSKITNQSVHVQEDLLVIHLCLVESSPNKICVPQIPVELGLDANQELTDLAETDLYVLVLRATEEILWSLVLEVNVKMTVNVDLHRPVTTSNVEILALMPVVWVPSAKPWIMVPFALVPVGTPEIPWLLVDLRGIQVHQTIEIESLDCLDSRDSHTLPAFFEIKNSNKYTIFDIL